MLPCHCFGMLRLSRFFCSIFEGVKNMTLPHDAATAVDGTLLELAF